MDAGAHDAPTARRSRWMAVLGASVFSAAIEVGDQVAHGTKIGPACVAFAGLSVLGELVILSAAFEVWSGRRLASAWCLTSMAALAIAVGIAEGFAAWGAERWLGIPLLGGERAWTPWSVLELGLLDGLISLGLWAMFVVYPFVLRDARTRAVRAERLRTAAELARLRAHLQPQFLRSTIALVAGLVGDDPRQARSAIGALGDLLRESLAENEETQTIDDEVRWLRRYAGILEARHRGALTFRWDIDEATRAVRVPKLLLQPLVENAVKHGALRRPDGGEVSVRTAIDAGNRGRVTCVVEDNGPGPGAPAASPGEGLAIVTRRLALEYAGAAAFRLESEGGLTRSVIELPAEAAS